MKEELIKRLHFVVYGEDEWRLRVYKKHGELNVLYDAHGQTVAEAKRTIINIINVSRIPFRLNIIHGFHNGTSIKDMLLHELKSQKVVCRFSPSDNIGKTIMRVS